MSGYVLNGNIKEATEQTKQFHANEIKKYGTVYDELEKEEYGEVVKRAVVDITDEQIIQDEDGFVLRDRTGCGFLNEEEAPASVNPYLYNKLKYIYFSGIVEIKKGQYYTAHGITGATINYVRTQNGWLIIDTGCSLDAADYATKLLENYLGENIRDHIKGVVYSHTHMDHYSGTSIFSNEGGKFPIYGPGNWEASKIADHFGAGVAMERRMEYQIGMNIEHGIKASLGYAVDWDAIYGKKIPIELPPDVEIFENQTVTVDGLEIEFILTPDTETKAHLAVFVPKYKVIYLADNHLDALHNIGNIRGIPVRDASAWGDSIFQIALKYGDRADAVIGGHGFPHFNSERRPENVKDVLIHIAAAYKYNHNQALHYANTGVTITEQANEFKIPDELARTWYVRENYGNYSFNARSIVTRYAGFYDGNPVNLKPLPKSERAGKLIQYIGSEDAVIEKAKEDFINGEYQWVAEIMNEIIFLNPRNKEARYLCADALEQLGYQQETATWRNSYLVAARELRDISGRGNVKGDAGGFGVKAILSKLTVKQLLDHIGIAIDGSKAGKENISFVLEVENERHFVQFFKGALLYEQLQNEDITGVQTVSTTREGLFALDAGNIELVKKLFDGDAKEAVLRIASYVVDFTEYAAFNIMEP